MVPLAVNIPVYILVMLPMFFVSLLSGEGASDVRAVTMAVIPFAATVLKIALTALALRIFLRRARRAVEKVFYQPGE